MNKKEIELIYISSKAIKEYCQKNPLKWPKKEEANENGKGNSLTPTPAVGIFYECLKYCGRLFTQKEYSLYAWWKWAKWEKAKNKKIKDGVTARLYRNFYPSCIDTMHVWALLVESGYFNKCIIDIFADSVSKTDITVWSNEDKEFKIALSMDNPYCNKWTNYKREKRGNIPKDLIDIKMTMHRLKKPGNKRWYNDDDLKVIYYKVDNNIWKEEDKTISPNFNEKNNTTIPLFEI